MDITLGTKIRFNKVSQLRYDDSDYTNKEPYKIIEKTLIDDEHEGMVVGMVKKATGKYKVNKDDYYGNRNQLCIDKFHNFYEVRTGLKNKPVLVHPDDVTVVEDSKIILPERRDIKYKTNASIYSEGNNGGDFVRIEEVKEGILAIKCGSCCIYNHKGIYPTEYLTRLLEYASLNLTPEKIFSGWNKDYVKELIENIKEN